MPKAAVNILSENGSTGESLSSYRWYELGLHLLYWLAYALLILVLMGMLWQQNIQNPNNKYFYALFIGLAVIPAILGFYSAYFLLAGRFLIKGKSVWLWLLVPMTSWVSTFTGQVLVTILIDKDLFFGDGWRSFFEISFFLSALSGVHVLLGIIIRGFFHGLREKEKSTQLSKKNLEMELALIKASLDPHFLFNTLNNIDVLIEKNPSLASEYLHQLSELLRFVLYENKAPYISLETDVKMMERYLDLQRIRLSQPQLVEWRVTGDTGKHRIPPMLFMPFLENTFKYGDTSKDAPAIQIHLEVGQDGLTFTCLNGIRHGAGTFTEGGLGLTLIKRRLELLYPDKHVLEIKKENGIFSVFLKLQS